MTETLSILVGAGVCFVVPAVSFLAGVYYARFYLPVHLEWRGFGRRRDEETEEG